MGSFWDHLKGFGEVRRARLIFGLLPLLLFWLLVSQHLLLGQQEHMGAVTQTKLQTHKDTGDSKQILFFNDFFDIKDWNFGLGHTPFSACPQPNCHVTR